MGLDLCYPVRLSFLCRAIAVVPCIGAVLAHRSVRSHETTPASMAWVVRYDTYCTRGRGHLRGERRESDRENERTIAMARKQREKDPRPRPQPPRTSQARRVAGIIVGPGSMVPGPLEPSLSRDRSRTLHRSGSRRSRIGRSVHMERRAITFCHFLWILTGIVTANLSRATCFSCLWVLAGIDTANLSDRKSTRLNSSH